jgi:hypothetical protein
MPPATRDAFITTMRWLEGGGRANAEIPFDFFWGSWSCCAAGGMHWVMHKRLTSDAIVHPAESHLGMDEEAFSGLFVNANLQLSKSVAKAMRKYLATGEIPDRRRQRETWSGTNVTIEPAPTPAPAGRRTIGDLMRSLLTPTPVSASLREYGSRGADDVVRVENTRERAFAPAD